MTTTHEKFKREKVKEIIERRDLLMMSNNEWARKTREVDPSGKGVTYQTIRRMESGHTPRGTTIRMLEDALNREEANRDVWRKPATARL